MSYSIDVNLLLYASDSASVHHKAAIAFLAQCAEEPEIMCLTWLTVMSYLRMATHPSIFDHPLSQAQAEANIASLIDLPQVRLISEQDGFWDIYRRCVTDVLSVISFVLEN